MASLEEDIAAAVDALGVEAAGVIYGIGKTHWANEEDRDAFLKIVVGKDGLG